MGMRINTNTAAMNAYRNLSVNDSAMSKSLEKLSSGFRINRAADDAAGLAISEGMKSQIGGLKVAIRNTQDGVSVVQTAEGALATTQGILQRMRDLSVQASNDGGLSTDAKKNIQSEVSQLKAEIDRIANTTTFNGKKLLDGSYTGKFQVGANAGETISVGVGNPMSSSGLGVDTVDVVGGTAIAGTVVNAVSGTPGKLTIDKAAFADAAAFDKLNGTISYGGKSIDLASVTYKSTDTTVALRQTTLTAAITAALGSGVTVAGGDASTDLTVTSATTLSGSPTPDEVSAASVRFGAASGAEAGLKALDAAIKTVSTQRANLGALQNRFEQTTANLNIAVENLTASNSRIVDVDMASEMTEFSKNQILVQAGTSMLAQANQSAQSVLKLLQ